MNIRGEQDSLPQYIRSVHHHMQQLQDTIQEVPQQRVEFIASCLQELQTALEQLRVAEEELYQQNEELIVARQQAELDRQRYQELFEFAPDGYLVTDLYGKVCVSNRVAAALLNLNREFLIGKPLAVFVPEDYRRTFRMMLNQLPCMDRVQEWELKLKTYGNQLIDVALTVATVRDEGGQAIALRWLVRDITARKQGEEKLQQVQVQNLQLIEADRLKSQFITTLSHELRTPMNAILGFSQLLLRQFHQQHDPQLVHMVDRIFSNGRHLLSLIEEMLDFSRLKSNRIELSFEEFDLAELLRTTVNELQVLAEQKNLRMNFDLLTPSPIWVVNDRPRLRQIIINLLANAIKFTDVGEVSVQGFELPEGRVAIAVRDTGMGIDPADHDAIFQEFWQANQTTTRRFGGTGLGLSITQALVKLMGGSINLESALDRGSTFRVELPRDASLVQQS